MNKYLSVYNLVTRLYCSLKRIDERAPTFLTGLAGELLVKSKLLENGIPFKSKGGQAGYDILLTHRNENNRIEVRTSVPKNEGLHPKHIMFHGWTIQKWKEDDVNYDFLICVALDKSLGSPEFYIFTKDDVKEANDVRIKSRKDVRKKLHLFCTTDELREAIKVKTEYVTDWEKHVNQKRSIFRNRWAVLR